MHNLNTEHHLSQRQPTATRVIGQHHQPQPTNAISVPPHQQPMQSTERPEQRAAFEGQEQGLQQLDPRPLEQTSDTNNHQLLQPNTFVMGATSTEPR